MSAGQTSGQGTLRDAVASYLGWTEQPQDQSTQLLPVILDTLEDSSFPGAVIPAFDVDKRLSFYAVADDVRQWRLLQPLLSAWIGMTLTTFDGRPSRALADRGLEGELTKRGLIVAKFFPPSANAADAVNALVRLIGLKSIMPNLEREHLRSAAEILYEFDLAIGTGDHDAAAAQLAELEARQLLDVINLHFLQVRLDAEFAEWRRLREHIGFDNLSRTRRPPSVTAALIEALYQTDVIDLPDEPIDGLIAGFESKVMPHAGDLFANLPPRRSGAVSISYLLYALASGMPGFVAELREEDPSSWHPDLQRRFALLLDQASRQFAIEPAPINPIAAVRNLLASNSENVLQLIASLVEMTGVATLEAQGLAQELAARISPLSSAGAVPEDVVVPQEPIPETWIEWFDSLDLMEYGSARRIAEQAADEWSVQSQLVTPDDVAALTMAIDRALSGANSARAVASIPHLIRWVQSDPLWPNPDLRPLYDTLLTALLISEVRRNDTFRGAVALFDGLLSLGTTSAAYVALLQDVRVMLRPFVSVSTIDSLLDAAEATTLYPCADEDSRSTFWAEVISLLGQFAPALTSHQRAVALDIGRILGIPAAVAALELEPEVSEQRAWDGLIGIYTLRDDVARRARLVLNKLYPAAQIEVSNAHVSSEELKRLAGSADLLVVSWSAAKHAATEALKRQRREGIIWVSGGASSIIAAVTKRIRELE